ncbi:MAG: hypothetical protein FJ096_01235 [Deltaproteobacteria bacterium]|nr:hypothetical protein [Deltaproteobacteria bacterium]
MRLHRLVGLASIFLLGNTVACSGEDSKDDDVTLPAGREVFAYGLEPAQTISKGPFPSDLYRGPDGIALAPLGADATYATLADAKALGMLDGAIDGRPGFGFAQPIQLFASEEIDLESLDGRVHLVATDGPEAGREVAVETWWSSHASALSFFPAPGDYLMPDTTYVLAIEPGATTTTGEAIGGTRSMAEVLAPTRRDASGTAWDRAAALRSYVAEKGVPVVATTFRTEPSLAPLEALLATVAKTKLAAPTRDLRYDPKTMTMVEGESFEGAALDALFGTPAAPFATNPGSWSEGARADAKAIGGAAYQGGSVRGKVAKVVFGSVTVPAFNVKKDGTKHAPSALRITGGEAESELSAMVPVTVFLCEQHLATASKVPVAVFTHGGTATRNNATALAATNCEAGVATVAHDLPFHGGRSSLTLVDGRLVPKQLDDLNELTGLSVGQDGFVPDGVGDPAGADVTVGNLFALASGLDPEVVEANLLTIPTELAVLVRLLREGDWSAFHPGLGFDGEQIFLENLSFGTTFTTGYLALSDNWRAAIGSTPSGHILGANLTVAPSNAAIAGTVVRTVLGLESSPEEIATGVYHDPVGGLFSWLAERGDSMAFAPYVLRHRRTKTSRNIVQSGDSWDETLSSPAQLSYNAALGLEVLESDGWKLDATIPGAASMSGKKAEAQTKANVTYGGVTHSAAIFYNSESCHAQLITPLCKKRYAMAYPPVVELPASEIEASIRVAPICSIHAQGLGVMTSLLDGADAATIVPPSGSCDALFGK